MRVVGDRWERWMQRRRDLYPGGRPNAEARAIHRRFVTGLQPRLLPFAVVLQVTGRHSGRPIDVPLATVRYRGHWYLVSMFGEHANWVRNVRATNGHAILTHGRRRPVHLVEVPVADRAPIIKRYLLIAIGARPHVDLTWNAPLADFEHHAHRYPVFGIEHP